ncbi:hypothetical protein ACFL2H_08170 [Planctomycetota bacterium]
MATRIPHAVTGITNQCRNAGMVVTQPRTQVSVNSATPLADPTPLPRFNFIDSFIMVNT